MAIGAVVDLLMKHGMAAFITNTEDNEETNCEKSGQEDDNTEMEESLGRDASTGAPLTQVELDTKISPCVLWRSVRYVELLQNAK